MAQLLRDDDSTDKHLSVVRRHQRRSRALGAQDLATAIEPARAELAAKAAASLAARLAEEDARDDLELADAAQDDEVRNLAGRAAEHDRTHPDAGAMTLLFRVKNPGVIVEEPLPVERVSIEQLASAIQTLGASHPLAPFATSLREKSRAVADVEGRLNGAISTRAAAEGEEEIAQAALRRAYESNYFDARRRFGKQRAERLFPRITTRAAKQKTVNKDVPT